MKKQILETEQKIIESKQNERMEREKQSIESMKETAKVFYSFINKQRSRRVEVGPFKKDKKFIYDGKNKQLLKNRIYFINEQKNQ